MLKIRLQRKGKKKQAFFRIVLQEHTEKLQGKYLELLGHYDPHSKELKVDKERVEHWLSQGAQLSPTLNNLLVNHSILDRPKVESWRPKKKEQAEEAAAPAAEETPATEEEKPAEDGEKVEADAPEEEAPAEKPEEAETKEDTTTEAAPAAA